MTIAQLRVFANANDYALLGAIFTEYNNTTTYTSDQEYEEYCRSLWDEILGIYNARVDQLEIVVTPTMKDANLLSLWKSIGDNCNIWNVRRYLSAIETGIKDSRLEPEAICVKLTKVLPIGFVEHYRQSENHWTTLCRIAVDPSFTQPKAKRGDVVIQHVADHIPKALDFLPRSGTVSNNWIAFQLGTLNSDISLYVGQSMAPVSTPATRAPAVSNTVVRTPVAKPPVTASNSQNNQPPAGNLVPSSSLKSSTANRLFLDRVPLAMTPNGYVGQQQYVPSEEMTKAASAPCAFCGDANHTIDQCQDEEGKPYLGVSIARYRDFVQMAWTREYFFSPTKADLPLKTSVVFSNWVKRNFEDPSLQARVRKHYKREKSAAVNCLDVFRFNHECLDRDYRYGQMEAVNYLYGLTSGGTEVSHGTSEVEEDLTEEEFLEEDSMHPSDRFRMTYGEPEFGPSDNYPISFIGSIVSGSVSADSSVSQRTARTPAPTSTVVMRNVVMPMPETVNYVEHGTHYVSPENTQFTDLVIKEKFINFLRLIVSDKTLLDQKLLPGMTGLLYSPTIPIAGKINLFGNVLRYLFLAIKEGKLITDVIIETLMEVAEKLCEEAYALEGDRLKRPLTAVVAAVKSAFDKGPLSRRKVTKPQIESKRARNRHSKKMAIEQLLTPESVNDSMSGVSTTGHAGSAATGHAGSAATGHAGSTATGQAGSAPDAAAKQAPSDTSLSEKPPARRPKFSDIADDPAFDDARFLRPGVPTATMIYDAKPGVAPSIDSLIAGAPTVIDNLRAIEQQQHWDMKSVHPVKLASFALASEDPLSKKQIDAMFSNLLRTTHVEGLSFYELLQASPSFVKWIHENFRKKRFPISGPQVQKYATGWEESEKVAAVALAFEAVPHTPYQLDVGTFDRLNSIHALINVQLVDDKCGGISSPLFYDTVIFGPKTAVKALFDSGCTINVISPAFARRLKTEGVFISVDQLLSGPGAMPVTYPDGTQAQSYGSMLLPISINGESIHATFQILDVDHDCMIGSPVIRYMRIIFDTINFRVAGVSPPNRPGKITWRKNEDESVYQHPLLRSFGLLQRLEQMLYTPDKFFTPPVEKQVVNPSRKTLQVGDSNKTALDMFMGQLPDRQQPQITAPVPTTPVEDTTGDHVGHVDAIPGMKSSFHQVVHALEPDVLSCSDSDDDDYHGYQQSCNSVQFNKSLVDFSAPVPTMEDFMASLQPKDDTSALMTAVESHPTSTSLASGGESLDSTASPVTDSADSSFDNLSIAATSPLDCVPPSVLSKPLRPPVAVSDVIDFASLVKTMTEYGEAPLPQAFAGVDVSHEDRADIDSTEAEPPPSGLLDPSELSRVMSIRTTPVTNIMGNAVVLVADLSDDLAIMQVVNDTPLSTVQSDFVHRVMTQHLNGIQVSPGDSFSTTTQRCNAMYKPKAKRKLPRMEINPTGDKPEGDDSTPQYTPRRFTPEESMQLDELLAEHLNPPEAALFRQRLEPIEGVFAFTSDHEGRLSHHIDKPTRIHVKEGGVISSKHFPLHGAMLLAARDIIMKGVDNGQFEPCSSPHKNPWFLVQKKNKDYRFILDCQGLNEITLKDSFHPPNAELLSERFCGNQMMSLLDIKNGYGQKEIHVADRDYTAFNTDFGSFRCTTLPQGWCNSPAAFHRAMLNVLRDIDPSKAVVFLDDIAVSGPKTDYGGEMHSVYPDCRRFVIEHMDNLVEVLTALYFAGLTVSFAKASLFVSEADFLGFLSTSAGRFPSKAKVENIMDIPFPTTVRALRAFLGAVVYFRAWIPCFGPIASPLYDCISETQKADKRKISPTPDTERAFKELKSRLVSADVLHNFDPSLPIVLTTDASSLGWGAVLSHEVVTDRGVVRKPIRYESGLWKGAERTYASTKLECLAVKRALEKLRYHLTGLRFGIETDNQALSYILSQTRIDMPNSLFTRWLAYIKLYDFSVKFIPGRLNPVADWLSRFMPVDHRPAPKKFQPDELLDVVPEAYRQNDTVVNVVCKIDAPFQSFLKYKGVSFATIINTLVTQNSSKTPVSPAFKRICNKFFVHDSLLWKTHHSGDHRRVLVTQREVEELLVELHDNFGHRGIPAMMAILRRRYYWPDMESYVKKHRRACALCASAEPRGGLKPPLKLRVPHSIWHTVSLDVLELPETHEPSKQFSFSDGYKPADLEKALRVETPAMPTGGEEDIVPDTVTTPSTTSVAASSTASATAPAANPATDAAADAPASDPPTDPVSNDVTVTLAPYKYLIVCRDNFSNWVEAAPLRKRSARAVAAFFHDFVLARYGVPLIAYTDNGTEFKEDFALLCEEYNIKHIYASARHPPSVGLIEGGHKPLLYALRKYGPQWVRYLHTVLWADRCMIRRSSGKSPFELLFGTSGVLPVESRFVTWNYLHKQVDVDHNDPSHMLFLRSLQLATTTFESDEVKGRLRASRIRSKEHYDKVHRTHRTPRVEVGNYVFLKDESPPNKIAPRWIGPFRVVMVDYETHTCKLADINNFVPPRRFHFERLKMFYPSSVLPFDVTDKGLPNIQSQKTKARKAAEAYVPAAYPSFLDNSSNYPLGGE